MPFNAAKMKQLRERLDLTQEALAKRVGVHRVTLTNIESGEASPTLAVVERLARVFRVKLDELIRRR